MCPLVVILCLGGPGVKSRRPKRAHPDVFHTCPQILQVKLGRGLQDGHESKIHVYFR